MKIISVFSILALVLIFGLAVAGCKTEAEKEGIDTALVAQWYTDEDYTLVVYEFKPDGKLLVVGVDRGITFTTSGGKITTSVAGRTMGTAEYSTSDKTLTLNNAAAAGLRNGTYYKK
jgi:hypothetical protein